MTTAELFKKYSNLYIFEEGAPEYLIDKEDFQEAMIKFAQHHVLMALSLAADKAKIDMQPLEDRFAFNGPYQWVNKESILESYPKENIK